MGTPFYDFPADKSFTDNLKLEYVVPVAKWFLRGPGEAYLLPQASGSNWECALAIEFLTGLVALPDIDDVLIEQVESKCIGTARWMMGQLRDEDAGGKSWDGAQWDTAVALRSLLKVFDQYDDRFLTAEKTQMVEIRDSVGKWLVRRVTEWASDIRYPAGPPDLAQVLSTLIALRQLDGGVYRQYEKECGFPTDGGAISEAVRLLIAMADSEVLADGEPGGDSLVLRHWVDPFNTSEVIDALSSFLAIPSEGCPAEILQYQGEVRGLVTEGLRFIECKQSEGTWGGVADTCGTLYGYLCVVEKVGRVSPQDPIVFKALRWMCDGNQTMNDGSFLHSGYPTVYFALSLLSACRSWRLGAKPAAEVYDIALWLTPNVVSHERSRRLDLELRNEDMSKRLLQLETRLRDRRTNLVSFLIGAGLAMVGLAVLALSALQVAVSVSIRDVAVFWSVVPIGITLISAAVGGFRAYARSRSDRS